MIIAILMAAAAAACSTQTVNQKGGITTCSVDTVIQGQPGEPARLVRLKDGSVGKLGAGGSGGTGPNGGKGGDGGSITITSNGKTEIHKGGRGGQGGRCRPPGCQVATGVTFTNLPSDQPIAGMPYSWISATGSGGQGEIEACAADGNRPDVIVCVKGAARTPRLILPFQPCGIPGASRVRCVGWEIGK